MSEPRSVERPPENSVRSSGRRQGRGAAGWPRWVVVAIVYFALLTGLGVIGGLSLNDASAANWSGPTANPPLGNIPVPVWNRLDATRKQENTAVDIDGYVSAGSTLFDLGAASGGNNVIYGIAPYDTMFKATLDDYVKGTSDYLILLETIKDENYTNRFRVDREGNLLASGNIWGGGCFGPVFVGVTTNKYKGDLSTGGVPSASNGYFAANGKCSAAGGSLAGSHVCSTAEMMNSIKCMAPGVVNMAFSGLDAWIQDGPPGYVAPANDCQGWRSAATTDLGRMWRFDAQKGGIGFLTTCNQEIVYACCK